MGNKDFVGSSTGVQTTKPVQRQDTSTFIEDDVSEKFREKGFTELFIGTKLLWHGDMKKMGLEKFGLSSSYRWSALSVSSDNFLGKPRVFPLEPGREGRMVL